VPDDVQPLEEPPLAAPKPHPADADARAPLKDPPLAEPEPHPADADARTPRNPLGSLRAEIWIVLGLSLGQSAVYAVVRLYERSTRGVPLAQQTATLNPPLSERPYLDLVYQLLGIGFGLVPVALALYLLSTRGRRATNLIGLDAARPARDLGLGLALAAAVGIPGLGLYAAARALGLSVEINPAGLDPHWWAVPVLVLSAIQNALVEEVVAVGYLAERLRDLRWATPAILVASALLRGTYHLYQGPGMAAGNVVMGLLFTWYYLKRRRVMPLVVAHAALDVVAFVGYTVLPEGWLEALGIN
jgi:membrane protease YdiL (CAAX protease family)